ncbi:MAG: hypothetical protein ACR2PO_03375 [Methyloligellaceae bacterium]
MATEQDRTKGSGRQGVVSRRRLFTGAAATAIAGTAGLIAKPRKAQAKVTKDIAYYRDYPDLENYARCGRCQHYSEGGHCHAVEGPVSAWGMCNLFRRRDYAHGYGYGSGQGYGSGHGQSHGGGKDKK